MHLHPLHQQLRRSTTSIMCSCLAIYHPKVALCQQLLVAPQKRDLLTPSNEYPLSASTRNHLVCLGGLGPIYANNPIFAQTEKTPKMEMSRTH